MFKQPYEFVSIQLDKLFFLPFASNETPEMRSIAIEAMLQAAGWTWDEVLNEIAKPEGN
jgi:hypothetical protein